MVKLEQVRLLCAQLWNPIGVPMANVASKEQLGFPPLPTDEYDTYLLKIIEMINSDCARSEVMHFLNEVESEYLMLSKPAGDKSRFLTSLYQTFAAEM